MDNLDTLEMDAVADRHEDQGEDDSNAPGPAGDTQIRVLEEPQPNTETALVLPTNNGITLTEEQNEAVARIEEWLDECADGVAESTQFRLGGYAGTGKTTLLRFVLDNLDARPLVCAFTGKACSVLRKKGIYANTIHSTIYRPMDPDSANPEFILKPRHEITSECDFFIVDEASMISTELYNDLRSYGLPILFVGDPGQLEPVGDNPNLMADPDYVLMTIHRQAEGNPILRLAHEVRQGGQIMPGIKLPQLRSLQWPPPIANMLMADQIICATNAMRTNWNKVIRGAKGFTENLVNVGEKVIVCRNDKRLGVFNGQILVVGEVVREYEHSIEVLAADLDIGRQYNIKLWKPGFVGQTPSSSNRMPRGVVFADYGYVITCHKSQGSEWEKVIVQDCGPSTLWDARRWRYTAITRASEALIYGTK